MDKKIVLNYKRGFRRIAIVLIIIITLVSICMSWKSFCWENYEKFKANVKICSASFNECIDPYTYQDKYSYIYDSRITPIVCNPFKQNCYGSGLNLVANMTWVFDSKIPDKINDKYAYIYMTSDEYKQNFLDKNIEYDSVAKVVMPSKLRYVSWYIVDIIKYVFIAFLIFAVYLIFEYLSPFVIKGGSKVLNWFIKGFKD